MFSIDTSANSRLKIALLSQLALILAATLLTALVWGKHDALVFVAIWLPLWALLGATGLFFGHLEELRRKKGHEERLRRRAALYGQQDACSD